MLPPTDSNASQITLVAPEPTTTLIFSKPSVINTTLFSNGHPLYSIATLDAAAERTTITDAATEEVLVTIQRRAVLADTVTFSRSSEPNSNSVKLKDWLKERTLETGYSTWTVETPIGNFVWRTDKSLRLALCPEGNLDHPIAWAQLKSETDPFALILTRGTEPFREEIVASFIILEQRMRLKEKLFYGGSFKGWR
ncbi:hypothetical protein CPB84DRAFT_1686529 [Gymnopilus junonius]|uniref:DUF6593 domain-containing protein n=1 Tax=Gymnopilus junonius TaxID=109634 RepID=A0A9P5NDZ0_GYMJU|nr:hypothetical protein CPB84DRAFT_1686529 [Gymnopilus junonius]